MLLGFPFAVMFASTFGITDNRQVVFPAKRIGYPLHFFVILFRAVVLDAIHKGNGVYNKVGMQVVCLVQMGCYQYLVAVPPQPLCQLDSNFMGKLRGSFSRGKGLVAVVGKRSAFLAKASLDHEHFFPCGIRVAVDTRNKAEHDGLLFISAFLDGFPLLHRVIDNVRQISLTARGCSRIGCGWVCCFLWIFGIVDDFSQAAPYTPDRCCSQ